MTAVRVSWLGLAGGLLALLTAAAYLVLISAEEGLHDAGRVAVVAATLTLAAGAAIAGSVLPGRARRVPLLVAAASALVVWGILAIFSVGVPLLVAGLFATLAALRVANEPGPSTARRAVVAVVVVVALTAVGITLTG